MSQLYANEHFPLPAVQRLRQLGHDVLTTHDAGNAGQAVPDDEVLQFAVTSNRAVLRINRKHFIRLHRDNPQHCGIVVCTFDPDFIGLADRIHAAIAAVPTLGGVLLRVNRPA